MTAWHTDGYAVVSDAPTTPGKPYTHRWVTSQWEAERELRTIRLLPADVVRNARIVRAVLTIEREGAL
jgi:hypothetical protein